jgi:hypothetical protein
MNPPAHGWNLTIPPKLWNQLHAHLFRGGEAEHGAVILAKTAHGPRGPRLLGHDVILAADGVDYVPGEHGHRALSPSFVRDAAVRARDQESVYFAVHPHPGLDRVGFSTIDLNSHQRGYPALGQITNQIVGGLVLTPHAAAGDLWLPDGNRSDLAELVIPAANLVRMRPSPARRAPTGMPGNRQSLLFGALGQETLRQMRVAVVGLGGVGSILIELLARLGVGSLTLIDDDLIDDTNLPRLPAAHVSDVGWPKTELSARNAQRANPDVVLTLINQRVEQPEARKALTMCDWIFLAADSDAARHWVNATVHQYLIPATQAGVKIPTNDRGTIGQIHAVSRLILPGIGCLWCNGLINPVQLAIDMQPEADRNAARYVEDIPAPSVITLNSIAAAEAANHFMLAVTGLHIDDTDYGSTVHLPRTRERVLQDPRRDPACRWCAHPGIPT